MRDPGSGWKGRQHAWDKIHAVSAKMNALMFKMWITVRKEWLEICMGITGGTMDEALLFAMDSEPIPCDEMQDTFNTKYAECILKLNATILLNGFIVHGGKIWVGTVTDQLLLSVESLRGLMMLSGAKEPNSRKKRIKTITN